MLSWIVVFLFCLGLAPACLQACQQSSRAGRMRAALKTKRMPIGSTVSDFRWLCSALPLDSFKVIGATSVLKAQRQQEQHPVVQAVLERWRTGSLPGAREAGDNKKIALAIEGGGMRGCVSAGATAALHFLGLADSVDIVYGSSAGAMIGSYFVTRQTGGIPIYYNLLPKAGVRFIDKKKLVPSTALPSFVPTSNVRYDVFNLDFLLLEVMQELQPLDMKTFWARQTAQPLKIVASSIKTFQPYVMSYDAGHFNDLPSLLSCVRASMSVPGATGGLMAVKIDSHSASKCEVEDDNEIEKTHNSVIPGQNAAFPVRERSRRTPSFYPSYQRIDSDEHIQANPLVDALLCEPIPYRSAVADGATHVIVLRTRPDPSPILGKAPGLYETQTARRWFARHKEDAAAQYMTSLQHHKIYAEDLVRLNDGARGPPHGIFLGKRNAHLLAIAPLDDCKEVPQLEIRRRKLIEGMRGGASRVFDIFLADMLGDDVKPEEVQRLQNELLDDIFPAVDKRVQMTLAQYRAMQTLQRGYE